MNRTITCLILAGAIAAWGCRESEPQQPVASERARVEKLERSDQRGLLGAPLPKGAVLESSHPGDRAQYIDPRENYRLDAEDEAVRGFYLTEMLKEGWKLGPNSSENTLFFEKGPFMLGVIIDAESPTFMLMGS